MFIHEMNREEKWRKNGSIYGWSYIPYPLLPPDETKARILLQFPIVFFLMYIQLATIEKFARDENLCKSKKK